jgi:acyl phosphate:glycerol-3-phosphate acyltransferase
MARDLWLLALAYLVGSFPTGALVAARYGVDLTQHGSRRTGATNALRVLGRRVGVFVLAVDAAKGLLAVTLARRRGHTAWTPAIAALVAMIGHTYSIFLGGSGGRGVATGLGGLLALSPAAVLTGAVSALVTIATTRLVSLGSLLGALTAGAALAVQVSRGRVPKPYLLYAVGSPAFLLFSHRENIGRLLTGREHRLGEPLPQETYGSRR